MTFLRRLTTRTKRCGFDIDMSGMDDYWVEKLKVSESGEGKQLDIRRLIQALAKQTLSSKRQKTQCETDIKYSTTA